MGMTSSESSALAAAKGVEEEVGGVELKEILYSTSSRPYK